MNGDLGHVLGRPAWAAAVVLLYALFCAWTWRRHRRRQRHDAHADAAGAPDPSQPALLVAFASQTGMAALLAGQTPRALQLGGATVRLKALGRLTADDLRACERALFIVSTYGDGSAPDSAMPFERSCMAAPLDGLERLHAGVLALGDSTYPDFCAFGRRLDAWLAASGAQALFERIEVDRGDEPALLRWGHEVARLAGTGDLPDWRAPAFEPWRLAGRELLNPGSAGEPLYRLWLEPDGHALPDWRSGDLVQVQAPADPGRPREYSIASVPAQGRIELLVRLERHPDGTPGVASGWLTQRIEPGAIVPLRLREHPGFRLGANTERPLVLIGNGTGLAGLLGHLKARAALGQRRHWLLFGERQQAHDDHVRRLLTGPWADGLLTRHDAVFSRDQPERRYVQHALREQADELRRWVADGAAIYVCGSLDGMAAGVDAVLREVLGEAEVLRLADAGRYRRDVY